MHLTEKEVIYLPEKPDKLQWHPAFYAAAELEFKEDIEDLSLEHEYPLSKEPIRIDLLILKSIPKRKLKNEIGHIMRTYNIIEYKSPDDGLTIDDFFKTIGYACLYKGYGKNVNQIPPDEITVSLFRAGYPGELFLTLQDYGYKIEKRNSGIYDVTGNLPFPVQVIVTRLLHTENHSSLRILTNQAEKADIERFLHETEHLTNPGDRENVSAVLEVSAKANYGLYSQIRREKNMNDVLRELMKEDIEEIKEQVLAEGLAEGRQKGLAEGLTEGGNIKLIELIQKKIKKGYHPNVIADMLEEEPDRVQTIYDYIMDTGIDRDAKEIYKSLSSLLSV